LWAIRLASDPTKDARTLQGQEQERNQRGNHRHIHRIQTEKGDGVCQRKHSIASPKQRTIRKSFDRGAGPHSAESKEAISAGTAGISP
ncbi:hypothetical protein, partial [Faecalibaculum rodentium]|uniref:hypothetical protein n=1 Tax=Faecalibaculum rodentium TaxID=1702221 RepID=UPI0023F4E7E6